VQNLNLLVSGLTLGAIYALVALVWFVPDKRIERRLAKD
jgi:hypothetical protein